MLTTDAHQRDSRSRRAGIQTSYTCVGGIIRKDVATGDQLPCAKCGISLIYIAISSRQWARNPCVRGSKQSGERPCLGEVPWVNNVRFEVTN